MIKLSNFRLTTRITSGFAVMVLLVAGVGAMAIWAMQSALDAQASTALRAPPSNMIFLLYTGSTDG